MDRARVAQDGVVRWTETCFCRPPLQHERETVLDRYFEGMEAEAIDAPVEFSGQPLIEKLRTLAGGDWPG